MAESPEIDNFGANSNSLQPAQRTRTDTLTSSKLPSVPRSEPVSQFSFMRRFVIEMDRLFEDFGVTRPLGISGSPGGAQPSGGEGHLWSPQIDVSTRNGQLQVHADLPGMRQEDVHVSIHDGVLSISGERVNQHEQNGGGVYRRERSYGSFRRAIALPGPVAPESIRASFENGVLEVTMPMPLPAEPKPVGRTIPISPKQGGGPDVH